MAALPPFNPMMMMGGMAQQQQYPICYHCKQIITVPYLIAFGQAWHKEHLACKVCRKDFSGTAVVREGPDGYAYCDPCAQVAFAPVCFGCKEQILSGDILTANETKWHPEHFCCAECKVVFGSTYFPTEEGPVYCEKHYYEKLNLLCAHCEHPLLGGQMISMGSKNYHLDHFLCKYCKKELAGTEYYEKDSQPYCAPCYCKLFG